MRYEPVQTAGRCVRAKYGQHPYLITKQPNPDYRQAHNYPSNMLSVSLTNVSRVIDVTKRTHMPCHSFGVCTLTFTSTFPVHTKAILRDVHHGIVPRLDELSSGCRHGQTHHLLRNLQTRCGGRPASHSMLTSGIKLTSHLHLIPRLRMNGATTLLPPYAFMAYKGTTLTLPLTFKIQNCRLIDIHILTGTEL
jgi:hypothetical protein